MKGNINIGDNIYKMTDKALNLELKTSFTPNTELRKIPLNAKITLNLGKPVVLNITNNSDTDIYKNLKISVSSESFPEKAKNSSLTKQKVIAQISKIQNTPYEFSNIDINLEDNLFLPSSVLNELKRAGIKKVKEFALNNIQRKAHNINVEILKSKNLISNKKISVLLNILDLNADYSKLEGIDNIYIPLKYFTDSNYYNILNILQSKFNLFVYLPTVIKNNYNLLLENNIEKIVQTFSIRGFVISNISGLNFINTIKSKFKKNFDFIGNYTLNVFNSNTANNLTNLGLHRVTLSPELDYESILNLCDTTNNSEIIVYGNIPLMNINYCLFGQTNKCKRNCIQNNSTESAPICNNLNSKYYLNDRLNFNFRIIADNIDTVSTIYNSKTTSISHTDFSVSCVRIDILDESVEDINGIVNCVKFGRKLEGKDYTNGNLNREI